MRSGFKISLSSLFCEKWTFVLLHRNVRHLSHFSRHDGNIDVPSSIHKKKKNPPFPLIERAEASSGLPRRAFSASSTMALRHPASINSFIGPGVRSVENHLTRCRSLETDGVCSRCKEGLLCVGSSLQRTLLITK